MKTNLFHICFLVMCLVILCMVIKPSRIENFLPGVFGFAPRVGGCTPENNCFRGSYLRSQIYTNVCQIEGENNMMNKLTRLPKLTKDRCYRTLANDDKFKCSVNKHGQRNCFWEK